MGQIWPIREHPLPQVDLEPTWGWGRPPTLTLAARARGRQP